MAQTIKAGGSKIVWDGKGLEKEIKRITKKKLRLAAEEVSNAVKRNISIGRPASRPGGFPHVDTGRLRNSIFPDMIDDNTAIVGTTQKYGLFLEIGATIRPKGAGALAVPVSDRARKFKGGARDFPKELVMVKRPGRPPILIEETKGRGKKRTGAKVIVHYVLLKSVRLAPRPYLRPTLDQMGDTIERIFSGKSLL